MKSNFERMALSVFLVSILAAVLDVGLMGQVFMLLVIPVAFLPGSKK